MKRLHEYLPRMTRRRWLYVALAASAIYPILYLFWGVGYLGYRIFKRIFRNYKVIKVNKVPEIETK